MPVDWVAAFDTLLAHPRQFNTSDLESLKALPGLDVASIGLTLVRHLPRDLDVPGEQAHLSSHVHSLVDLPKVLVLDDA